MKRIKRVLQIAVGVLSLGSFGAAHADTFSSYQINATLADGGTFNAVLNFDSTYVFGTTLVGSYATAKFSGSVNEALSGFSFPVGLPASQMEFQIPQGTIALVYPAVSVSYLAAAPFTGTLCLLGNTSCDGYFSEVYGSLTGPDPFISATVTPLAATPEPSSLALLGTGLVGLVGAVRRRKA